MTEMKRKWPAPAKLNLMLRITGQRADGYHLLQTVFQFVDWCDWLVFTHTEAGRVSLKKPLAGVPEESDLTVRAANLLKQKSGFDGGVQIEVEKNLPMGGGLGGGSSDAASTLVALNSIWELGLSQRQLLDLGLQLGADVPVFVFGHSAWAEGVGEVLTEIMVPEQWFVIIKPNCHVDTRKIFSEKKLTRNSKPVKISDFIAGLHQNDCVDVVRELYPLVDEALSDLSEFAEARLTGTGACVFAQFASEQAAREAFFVLQKKWRAHLAKGVNSSPLYLNLPRSGGLKPI